MSQTNEMPVGQRLPLGDLITGEILGQLQTLDLEYKRLLSLADDYSPAKLRLELDSRRARHAEAPTEESFRDLVEAPGRTNAVGDPWGLELSIRYKELRAAAGKTAERFYKESVAPCLTSILTLAIEALRAELEPQKAREAGWLSVWEKWQLWARYYGASLKEAPSIFRTIEQRIEQVKALAKRVTDCGDNPPEIRFVIHTVFRVDVSPAEPAPALAGVVPGRKLRHWDGATQSWMYH